MKKYNVIAIILARGGSKGIKGKNIIDFCGKPLLAWSIEQAKSSSYINDVYVSSDNNRILKVAENFGAKTIKRPAILATDFSTSEDALGHVLDSLESKYPRKIDAVVFLQATSPLRTFKDIDLALKSFFSQKADSLFSAAVLEDCCIWKNNKKKWESITFDYKKRGRRQDNDPYCWENGSIYIFRPEVLKRHQNRLGGKIIIYPMPFWQFYEIDKYDDIEICEYFMKKKILSKEEEVNFNFKDISLIVYDFDGVLTDNKAIIREDGLESVSVNRLDGLAISIFKKHGMPQIILTTETNKIVETRAQKLTIPVFKGEINKKRTLIDYCSQHKIPLKKVLYVGDEINDLEAMKLVGFPVCPINAAPEIKQVARFCLPVMGGDGVVRKLLRCFDIENM